MQDLSGQKLGPYDIIGEIGHGGMANVYRARQTSIGRDVAIKVLPPFFLQDRTFLERFNREVQVIARLQHPRILPVIDYGQHEGTPYIVMAYMPGGTLAERIRSAQGGLPLDEVGRLVAQIAEGLDYAHEKGIIHRDFKPSNVLLDEKDNAHLADFGIAKITADTAQLTGSGVIGTPSYMAPEMTRAGGVTPLVDVYALGVTLFQMLTGRQPYAADTPIGVMMAHATEPIPDARHERPDLPEAVQPVIEKAMAKDPRTRYQSAGALAADLTRALAGASPVTAPAATHLPAAEPPALHGQTQGMTIPVPAPPPATARPASIKPMSGRGALRGPGLVIAGVIGVALIAGLVILLGQGRGVPSSQGTASPQASSPAATEAGQAATPAGTGAGALPGHIYFTSDRDGNKEIYSVRPDGSGLTRLTNNTASDTNPAISSDGRQLMFVTDREEKNTDQLYIMNPDGSNQRRLRNGQPTYGETPRWSPDGTRVALSVYDNTANVILVQLLDLGSGNMVSVSSATYEQWNPSFSPDGQQIAFSEQFADSDAQIYVVHTDGSGLKKLTQGGGNRYPAWSPDGSQILYASDDGWIYGMKADGSGQSRLTDGSWAAWSPDGKYIVFTSFRGVRGQMYIMTATGQNVTPLLDSAAKNTEPVWGN